MIAYRVLIPLAASLTLGASQDAGVSLTDASQDQVIEAVQRSGLTSKIRAGRWSQSIRVIDFSKPGTTADQRNQILAAEPRTSVQCIASEQDKVVIPGIIPSLGEGCSYRSYKLTGKSVSMEVVCADGGTRMAITGNFSPLTYYGQIEATVGEVKSKIEMTLVYRGQCRGDEAKD
ncbi:DUF3617 family protein [Sphingomonas sp. AOB5]|uniref:DUF3617 domain-containing protein n=1 Tax=Sphingomonas sp. AOB5 TaxID=3034017 RepID=UPI0023F8246B|nr:DUF3617 family protein [Sphingomonas sp. AOB5]MDF7776630.1 DUF3617 family protein [Sphingomonas sp. AOB5]